MDDTNKKAIEAIEQYIREYEDAPSWGGPTMYPSPPPTGYLRLLVTLAKANIAGKSQV